MNKIKNIFKIIGQTIRRNRLPIILIIAGIGLLSILFTRELVSLTGGLSGSEANFAKSPIGWQGIISDSFYLPLKLMLSAGYFLFDQGGALTSRLPSVILGITAVVALTGVVKAWHGNRIAIYAGLLFATSAWTLHVTRFAGFESSYLLAVPVIVATIILLQRSQKWWIPPLVLLTWSILLFTPGLVWLILLAAFWERYSFADAWTQASSWLKKLLLPFSFLIMIPLLIFQLAKSTDNLLAWLGLPPDFGTITEFAIRFAEVPLNLLLIGPNNPELWLGRLPLLDLITVVFMLLGIVYYVKRWRAARAQMLLAIIIIAWLLVALGGPAGLSLVVPIVYLLAGSGIAQLNNEWRKRFPNNPIARSFGTTLLIVAVAVSCLFNLRSYFIAWPNNPATISKYSDR